MTNQIREERKVANGKRIDDANNEAEYWKVVNDIISPRSEPIWKIIEDNITIVNNEVIAAKFNDFFVKKIEVLKSNIDINLKEDPLSRLSKKMEHRNLKFNLKTVSVKTVIKAIKSMKKKKSSGIDGVTQECLLNGMEVLAIPLTHIVNTSITSGTVPDSWKEAIVVPILKKGDSTELSLYNPSLRTCPP